MNSKLIDSFRGDYGFLSNFYHSPIKIGGKEYKTVEHAYQSFKIEDEDDAEKVRLASTPSEAKRLGGKYKMKAGWDKIKVGIMYKCLLFKFEQTSFRNKLLATGDAELIEGNTWGDKFWGQVKEEGRNELGKLLMKIREQIKNGEI